MGLELNWIELKFIIRNVDRPKKLENLWAFAHKFLAGLTFCVHVLFVEFTVIGPYRIAALPTTHPWSTSFFFFFTLANELVNLLYLFALPYQVLYQYIIAKYGYICKIKICSTDFETTRDAYHLPKKSG